MDLNSPTILHLSDLHFSKASKTDDELRNNILEQLIIKVESISKDDPSWRPDILAFSGDIANTGDEEEYDKAAIWLNKLVSKLDLEPSDVFICPGNHDIIRDRIRKSMTNIKSVHDAENYAKSELLFKKSKIDELSHPFSYFIGFCRDNGFNQFDDIAGLKKQYLFGTTFHEKSRININVLNSSWMCRGYKPSEGIPSDKGNLFVSHLMVNGVFRHAKDIIKQKGDENENIPVITIIHHPPDWLSWKERFCLSTTDYPVYEYIADFSDVIFSGHEHALGKRPDVISTEAHLVISGASYHKDFADGKSPEIGFNSFNLVKISKEHLPLIKREFYFNLKFDVNGEWEEFVPKRKILKKSSNRIIWEKFKELEEKGADHDNEIAMLKDLVNKNLELGNEEVLNKLGQKSDYPKS